MAAHERSSARAVVVATLLAFVPVLIGCSSSPGAYSSPFGLFHSARAAPPPAVSAPATANNAAIVQRPAVAGPPPLGTASAGTMLAGLSPPGFVAPSSPPVPLPPAIAPTAAAAPAKSADFDAAASAYPTVSLVDLFRDGGNSSPPAKPARPVVSDTVTPAAGAPATGQAAPAASSGGATAAAAPAPPASSDDSDPAAASYPSVSLYDIFRDSSN